MCEGVRIEEGEAGVDQWWTLKRVRPFLRTRYRNNNDNLLEKNFQRCVCVCTCKIFYTMYFSNFFKKIVKIYSEKCSCIFL